METAVAMQSRALLRELESAEAEPAPPPPLRGSALLRAWLPTATLGGLVGLAFPAAVVAILATDPRLAGLQLAALVAAGAALGFCVGVGQSLPLQRALPSVRRRTWAGYTAVGMAVAWMAGAIPVATVVSSRSGLGTGDLVLVAGMTLIGVTAVGAAQWLELRRALLSAAPWLLVSALAWLAGAAVVAVGVAVFAELGSTPTTVAGGVGAGVIGTVLVAALTGLSLRAILSADDRARERRRAEYIAETAWLLRTVDLVKRGSRRERMRSSARRAR